MSQQISCKHNESHNCVFVLVSMVYFDNLSSLTNFVVILTNLRSQSVADMSQQISCKRYKSHNCVFVHVSMAYYEWRNLIMKFYKKRVFNLNQLNVCRINLLYIYFVLLTFFMVNVKMEMYIENHILFVCIRVWIQCRYKNSHIFLMEQSNCVYQYTHWAPLFISTFFVWSIFIVYFVWNISILLYKYSKCRARLRHPYVFI